MNHWAGVLFHINERAQRSPRWGLPGDNWATPLCEMADTRPSFTLGAAEDVCRLIPGAWIALGHSHHANFIKLGIVESAMIADGAVVVSGTAERQAASAPLSLAASADSPWGLSIETRDAHSTRRGSWIEIHGVRVVDGVAISQRPCFRSAFWWLD
jgi:hypothetical protein